ncbi:MAG: fibronectin type III domain-containing protein, partial [Bacilli bacterium]|nr:fibronectin type III domain-containing protein [Bacilli bacterium]
MKKYKIIGITLVLLFLVFGFFCIPVKASMTELSMISTNPGEDSSSQVRISWQSNQASCVIKYTIASDTSFKDATEKTVAGAKNTIKYSGNETYYKYDVNLENLQADTKYIYQIKAGSATS